MKNLLSDIKSKNPVPILMLYYGVGVAGLILPLTREIFMRLTSLSLLLSLGLLFLYHPTHER